MSKMPPIYRRQNKTIVADRCKPLTQAAKTGQVALHALTRNGYPGSPLAKKELPGLLSMGFWDVPAPQHWGLDLHCNEGIELTWLETGRLVFNLDRRYTLKPGDMTITRPWQPHSLGNPYITPGRLHWLILDVGASKPHQRWVWPDWFILTPADLGRLTTLLRQNEAYVWTTGDDIAAVFRQIAEIIQSPKNTLRLSKLTILVNELLLSLYELLKTRRVHLKPELTTSERTVELFLDNLKSSPELLTREWTIQSMARYCDLGVTHFTRLCKTLSNRTPMQYLNYQRIEAAINLMQSHPQLTLTDIAFRSGFNSSQYFATVFKRYRGVPPSRYKF